MPPVPPAVLPALALAPPLPPPPVAVCPPLPPVAAWPALPLDPWVVLEPALPPEALADPPVGVELVPAWPLVP